MDQTPASTPAENVLHCALELSKNTWLLGIQFPDRPRPSLYPIDGGDTDKLMAKLIEARDRWAKVSGEAPAITVCYEVGYDAVWLARYLKARGINCLVVDPASLQVDRRARRAKTDRIDVAMLLRALISWGQGEHHVWSLVLYSHCRRGGFATLASGEGSAGSREDCIHQPHQGSVIRSGNSRHQC